VHHQNDAFDPHPTSLLCAAKWETNFMRQIAPKDKLLAGRKSDAIRWEKPPCQQLNEGEK
jgi:hypothetical protein